MDGSCPSRKGDDMKIKAALVRQKSGPFLIEDIELDEPREDEVLVRIAATGLCHTDLAVRDGHTQSPIPIVLGHEGSGVVERVGTKVRRVKPGDHVVLSYYACGTCLACRSGRENLCLKNRICNFGGIRLDGSTTMKKDGEPIHGSFFGQSSFASHALAYERNAVPVRKDVPIEMLGPLGCGVQTGAGGVINSLRPKPGSSLAVFGTGGVGMSAILAAVVCGCSTVIAVDVKKERLKAALELRGDSRDKPNGCGSHASNHRDNPRRRRARPRHDRTGQCDTSGSRVPCRRRQTGFDCQGPRRRAMPGYRHHSPGPLCFRDHRR